MERLWVFCFLSLHLELGFRPGSFILPLSIVDSMPDFVDECWELNSGPHTCSPSFLSSPERHLCFEDSLTFLIMYCVYMRTHAIVYMWRSEDNFQESVLSCHGFWDSDSQESLFPTEPSLLPPKSLCLRQGLCSYVDQVGLNSRLA